MSGIGVFGSGKRVMAGRKNLGKSVFPKGDKGETVVELPRPESGRRQNSNVGIGRMSQAMNRDGMSETLLADLPGGFSLYEIADDTQYEAEVRYWRGLAEEPPALRSRLGGSRLFAVRASDGFPRCLIEAGGEPASVRTVFMSRTEGAFLPAAAALGRALVAMGIGLAGTAFRFCAVMGRDGPVFLDRDGSPDRLETDGDVHVGARDPISLPKVLVCNGNFMLIDSPVARNPVSVTVRGSMTMENVTGLSVPSHLHVEGDYVIRLSDASTLPSRFSVGRDLDISGTGIEALPEHFHVGRNIVARKSLLSSLKGGLTVKGNLDLSGCPISKLAWGLDVAGTLDVSRTMLTEIPGDAVIGGDLMVDDHVSVPSTVRIGGRLLYARPFGYETAKRGAAGARASATPSSGPLVSR